MKNLILLSTIAVITGCSNSDNPNQNINSPLLGTWETQACEEVTDSSLSAPFTTWSKATYEFFQNGDIVFTPDNYLDSTCINKINSLRPDFPIAAFRDFGEITLEEGILGNKLNITIQATGQTISTSGFYTINNNILCFSHSYSFEPNTFGVSLNERPPIDFTTCLVPHN